MNASDAAYDVLAKAGAPVHVKNLTARIVQPIDVATRLEGAVAPCLHAVDPARSAEFDPVGYELDQSIEHARQAVKDALPRAGWMRIGNSTSDIVATPDAAEPSRYVGPEPGG